MVIERRLRNIGERSSAIPGEAKTVSTSFLFPDSYVASPLQRLRDMRMLDKLRRQGDVAVDFRRNPQDIADIYDLRIYSDAENNLDAIIPLLHNLGLPAIDQNLHRLSHD